MKGSTRNQVGFLHVCVILGIVQPAELSSLAFQEKLSGFKDMLLQGITIIRIPDELTKK